MPDFASVLITGASSGIGRALAIGYAREGRHLYLSGRDAGRLDEAADACRARGAAVDAAVLDVTDAKAVAHWIAECAAARPLDLVIANAGISGGSGGREGEPAAQARRILAVNVDGVVNTVQPALDAMLPARHGHIVIMSSLASFRGFPGAPAYCASKAAVRVYGEALRGEMRARGVDVTVICPGFVKSAMTAKNPYPMPMLMAADRAAAIIMRGLARNRARIAFPWPLYALMWSFGALPPSLTNWMFRRLPKKP